MLRIYLNDEINDSIIVNDVEKQFASITLKCTDKERELVKKIEQGSLVDSTAFIDRFGFKLYLSELSTGCKAALCTLNFQDSIIDLVECGLNARDIIISCCDKGSVLIDINSATIANTWQDSFSCVRVNDYVFTSINRLNTYLFSEYPFDPDLTIKGIEKYDVFVSK